MALLDLARQVKEGKRQLGDIKNRATKAEVERILKEHGDQIKDLAQPFMKGEARKVGLMSPQRNTMRRVRSS